MLVDLPSLSDLQTVFAGRLAGGEERKVRYRLLDTFDWRLWSAGCALSWVRDGAGTWLVLDDGGAPLRTAVAAGLPRFVDEIGSPGLAARLAGPVGIRRLLPIVEIEARERTLRLLDGRGKTVVRLVARDGVARAPADPGAASQGTPRDVELPPSLEVQAVRGYEEEARRALQILEGELRLVPRSESLAQQALAAIGRRAGDYTSKFRLTLEPGVTAGTATRRVLAHLLATVRRNEDGARLDLDPEFLHDLRVAVRRTRSALGQLEGVLAPGAVERLQEELKWLGRLTGPVRDLDVQKLHLPEYRAELAPEEARALDPLERLLDRQHAARQREMLAGLDSPRYRALLAAWRDIVDTPMRGEADGQDATRPAVEVARERIDKLQRKVLKKGAAVDDETEMPALHRLRIDCKKLRYMMELFRSLFASEEIDTAIDRLRRIQNTLGRIHDLDVQQRNLRGYAQALAEEGTAAALTLLTIGRIVERMARREERERRRFTGRFSSFADQARRHPAAADLAARAAGP
ncbi:MAG: CHAD domain-containing protein [Thermoanaerobaculia bacterium]